MQISLIVAMSTNNIIGNKGKLPWHLPADLKYFKKTTLGHHIIMGRKTYESIGKVLPGRTNIVISRRPDYWAKGCLVVHSLEQGLELVKKRGEQEVFIIGGAYLYDSSLSVATEIYLTKIQTQAEGDAKFPTLAANSWQEVSRENHMADDKNSFDYSFTILKRI